MLPTRLDNLQAKAMVYVQESRMLAVQIFYAEEEEVAKFVHPTRVLRNNMREVTLILFFFFA